MLPLILMVLSLSVVDQVQEACPTAADKLALCDVEKSTYQALIAKGQEIRSRMSALQAQFELARRDQADNARLLNDLNAGALKARGVDGRVNWDIGRIEPKADPPPPEKKK